MKILNFGSLNFDYVYQIQHFPSPGETISALNRKRFFGGKGLNQSIAVQSSGYPIFHAGQIGQDGNDLINVLKKHKIDTSLINICDIPTGHAVILIDSSGENCIVLDGGANQKITKDYADSVLEHFEKGDILILQNEINCLDHIINQSVKRGLNIVFNPAPFNKNVLKLPLEKIQYLCMNTTECLGISGKKDIKSAISWLLTNFPETHLLITLGKHGCIYIYKNTVLSYGIYNVPVVDTTAAGDTFIGYFIGRLALGDSIEKSLETASRASSLVVSKAGASNSIPTIEEVFSSDIKYQKPDILPFNF